MTRAPLIAIGTFFLLFTSACKQEDVAPHMALPPAANANNDAWDAPPQEMPEPPPTDGKMDASASDDQDNADMPPPPEGDDIPLGAPPLPDGVKGIKVKGKVVFVGYTAGLIQIDVSDKGVKRGHKGVQPKVIQLYRMDKPGAFEIEIPENTGEIYLSAYNDEDQNGRPSRAEPRGLADGNPYHAGTEEIDGVVITMERERIPAPPPGN